MLPSRGRGRIRSVDENGVRIILYLIFIDNISPSSFPRVHLAYFQ